MPKVKPIIAPTAAVPDRDFIRVGKSRIAGTGVFAKRRIHWGARIIEYIGKRRFHSELLQEIVAGKPASVYLFEVHAGVSIDGAIGGNESRFINHSCEPNCEANVFDDRV
jgi:SET domain-containing protein